MTDLANSGIPVPPIISINTIIAITLFAIALITALWRVKTWFDKMSNDTKIDIMKSSGLVKEEILKDNIHVREILSIKIKADSNRMKQSVNDLEEKLDVILTDMKDDISELHIQVFGIGFPNSYRPRDKGGMLSRLRKDNNEDKDGDNDNGNDNGNGDNKNESK